MCLIFNNKKHVLVIVGKLVGGVSAVAVALWLTRKK